MKGLLSKIVTPQIIVSILVGIAAIIAYSAVSKSTKKYTEGHKDDGGNTTVRNAFSLLRFSVIFIAVIVILQINNINITAMVAGLGIVSAIVGLALQDYLKDIIMGVHILADRFFKVGECVEFEGRECSVLSFNLKTTKLCDLEDRRVITVCNRNISMICRLADRLDIDIPLSYNENQKAVKEAICNLCGKIEALNEVEKCEYVGTNAFESSLISHRVRITCDPVMRADVRHAALGIIKEGLDEMNITIPFNQLDVHFDNLKQ